MLEVTAGNRCFLVKPSAHELRLTACSQLQFLVECNPDNCAAIVLVRAGGRRHVRRFGQCCS